ncbi:MAG: SIS domain-containing protein [Microthrixaceae bacterium]|nr:SIS domain-containing protein [Microthrixaceae bacterium]
MCGIIAVLRRPHSGAVIDIGSRAERLDAVCALLEAEEPAKMLARPGGSLHDVASELVRVDADLRGLDGLVSLLHDPPAASRVDAAVARIDRWIAGCEALLDDPMASRDDGELEALNAELARLKDATWAIGRDRLRAAREVDDLVGPDAGDAAMAVGFSIYQALSSLDRLEVRGRDSAGVEIVIWRHGLDLTDDKVASALAARRDPLFVSGSVQVACDALVFVYKAAAEIGELGDNTAVLRNAIRSDELLRAALAAPTAEAVVLGHTRWASVGIISESNAHPQSSEEIGRDPLPFVTAVLNGDVDNFADLIAAEEMQLPATITTDAKVIPAVMARRIEEGLETVEAFRETVRVLDGSVAIGAVSSTEPGRILLALRGSGQALYVGLADDAYLVASEPYGVVEDADEYLRMDGECPSDPTNPTASRGQIVALDAGHAGDLGSIRRWSYDGTELPVSAQEVVQAEITTRDIDRGSFPHFLLKEISDAPGGFRKTLRGKLVEHDGELAVMLGAATLPPEISTPLVDGTIQRVLVIGQGTAAAAGHGLVAALDRLLEQTAVRVEAVLATELSGFRLRADMSDTLVVAISQSGTTTDTNRTVDLARSRGARVIAVVNRRNSDLCDKSDGVLYTSDGRDVEMSVASTKAFYAQIAAGMLLAYAISELVDGGVKASAPDEQHLLRALRELPERMVEVLGRREDVAVAAQRFAPSRRYWAIVGNGANSIAAREVRIKLSELCYKSIACDATEDKKHIDLSSEPLILVCAAGLGGSIAADVGKEIAIYRAHKAAPIVIATEGEQPYGAALHVIAVPETDPRVAFVLSSMVGHLFGYEAALAIDAQANPLREARGVIERVAGQLDAEEPVTRAVLDAVQHELQPLAATFLDSLRAGAYNGHLEAATAVRVASLFRYATGISGLASYQAEFGKVGTPGVVLDDLTAGLTAAIEELTRPIDAIKHQAKTVTVGISRSDESLLHVGLVAATLSAGAPRDRLSYATLRSLADLDPAVVEVLGSTRYRVEDPDGEDPTVVVVDRAGIAANLVSRAERDPRLRGTKHLVAREQELMVAQGRSDGRLVLIVPETKDSETTGLTLLHLRLHDRLGATVARGVLSGYRRRYQALRDHVTETEDVFREDLLAEQPTVDLLCEPIWDLANRWRS